MHLSSMEKMADFRRRYLQDLEQTPLSIVDLGSLSIGGNYRSLFDAPAWTYSGMDLVPGENVDIVLSDPYNWLEIESGTIDVAVSGQAFEHIEFFWKTALEISRVLKPGGLCCLIAPSKGPEHRYPVDCWRFYPDGFNALARYAGLDALEIRTDWEPKPYSDNSHEWADTLMVARKPSGRATAPADPDEQHIYRGAVTEDEGTALSKIIHHIAPGSSVLELGPATGYLTAYLAGQLGCVVDCVEISPEMAESAKPHCRRMIIADLDEIDLAACLEPAAYDYIVIADVLEHLVNGEKVLQACRSLLKPGGKCLLSIPNIAHAAILGSLIKGEFEYTREGLLDQTHKRFYTRNSIVRLVQSCGLFVETIERVLKLPEETEIGDSLSGFPMDLQKAILDRTDALAYQYVVACGLDAQKAAGEERPAQGDIGDLIDVRRLHLEGQNRRIAELEKGLSHATELALSRMAEIAEYQAAFSHARDLALTRMAQIERLADEQSKLLNEMNVLKRTLLYRLWVRWDRLRRKLIG